MIGTTANFNGFTLLELLIAIMLMAFLSIMTTQSIQRAVKTKTKMQKTIDINSSIRDAVRVMERDIQQAFHYRDFTVDMFNAALTDIYKPQSGATGAATAGTATATGTATGAATGAAAGTATSTATATATGPATAGLTEAQTQQLINQKKKRPLAQYTFFFGEEEKLTLTTRTNARTYVDQKVSDQLRVSYYLDTCKLRRDLTKTTKCLWRKVDPFFEESVEMRNGNPTVLLEGIESMKLRYMGDPQRREWSRDWKSKEGDPSMREKFPLAVEITLNVIDPSNDKAKPIVVQTVAQIRNPNNEDPAKARDRQQTLGPGGLQQVTPGIGTATGIAPNQQQGSFPPATTTGF